MEIVLIIVGVAIVVLGFMGVAVHLEKKRTATLEQVAQEMGLEFLPNGDSSLEERMKSFQLFNQGRARKFRNLIIGETDEVSLAVFDYQYTTGSGKSSNTWRQTVAALQSRKLDIPSFSMRPEGLFDRIGGVFGMQDIDFNSHPEFSKMFVLKSQDEPAVRDFFDEAVLSFFETKKGISIEAVPFRLIIYQSSKRLSPQQLKTFLEQAYQVYGVFVDRLAAPNGKPSS